MSSKTFAILSLSAVLSICMVGCGGSSTPQSTEHDEITQYLADHPELDVDYPENE